jgi:hypothetical protein
MKDIIKIKYISVFIFFIFILVANGNNINNNIKFIQKNKASFPFELSSVSLPGGIFDTLIINDSIVIRKSTKYGDKIIKTDTIKTISINFIDSMVMLINSLPSGEFKQVAFDGIKFTIIQGNKRIKCDNCFLEIFLNNLHVKKINNYKSKLSDTTMKIYKTFQYYSRILNLNKEKGNENP